MNIKHKYRLILTTEESNYGEGRSVRAKLEICYLGDEGLCNPVWSGGYGAEACEAYADLVVRAQCDPESGIDTSWYGWGLEFHKPYSVDLKRAESMCAVLRSLARKLAKLDERFGSPDTFEAYAARVADVLGGWPHVQFGRKVDAAHDYDGSGYQFASVDSLRYWLQDAIKERVS